MKHFVWAVAVAAAFVIGFVIPTGTPETETETVPTVCADAFYQLAAAHVVTTETLLENNLDGALRAVEYGSEALDMWAESCV